MQLRLAEANAGLARLKKELEVREADTKKVIEMQEQVKQDQRTLKKNEVLDAY
jgi:hypothetical protein